MTKRKEEIRRIKKKEEAKPKKQLTMGNLLVMEQVAMALFEAKTR